jgi:hypothetical protein
VNLIVILRRKPHDAAKKSASAQEASRRAHTLEAPPFAGPPWIVSRRVFAAIADLHTTEGRVSDALASSPRPLAPRALPFPLAPLSADAIVRDARLGRRARGGLHLRDGASPRVFR